MTWWLRAFIAHLIHPADCCLVDHSDDDDEAAEEFDLWELEMRHPGGLVEDDR